MSNNNKKRLYSIRSFLANKNLLIKNGIINLKTDSKFLHGYLIGLIQGLGHEIIYSNHDIYNRSGAPIEATTIQTYYESLYLTEDKPITYLKFRYNS